MFSPTTPSGASRLRASPCSGLPLRPRGRTGVFRRREGPPRLLLWASPSSASSCLAFLLYEAFPHAEERRLRIHAFCGSALPFFWSYVFFPEFVYARAVPVRGRSDVLSRPRLTTSSRIALHISSLMLACSAEPFSTGAAGRVFPVAIEYIIQSTAA